MIKKAPLEGAFRVLASELTSQGGSKERVSYSEPHP